MSPKGIAPAVRNPRKSTARRVAYAAAAAAAALTAAACGEVPTGTVNTPAGYTVSSDDVPVSICPSEGETRFEGDEGLLRGAHFALRVECLASFEEVPEGFQLEYLLADGYKLLPPPEGYEFTIVQFAPEPGVEAPYAVDDLTELTGKLAIGDVEWEFAGESPKPGAVYFTVAEKGAPVTLELTDAERTQTLDLRERTRTGLIEALYNGSTDTVTTDIVENSVDGYTTSGSYEYWFDDWQYSTDFTLTREVYRPGKGWVSAPDAAVLNVTFGWLQSGSGLEWDIDPTEALTVADPNGPLAAASATHVDEEWGDGIWRTYTLVYNIPAASLVFDLTFHPDGPVTWPEEDVSMPITGDKTHELTASFE
ncbi:hypothetical protein GCM10009853_042780 [Glycomyces scopariae]|uniref:Uncharacterized protein n=1 Tax=Glycomyces sambucus TaxID=380244 RepID=A0A1G9DYV3_9ACTN|nr:hypothetical protein [Glycomyces sambucus]SDK69057.1 hypothetical protein SAMN05216298_1190 [Glycomyces sambucus]